MRRLLIPTMLALLTFFFASQLAYAKSPVKIQKLEGAVDMSADAPFPFALRGTASHLGKFTAYGEVDFLAGEEEGSLVGDGVVVFEAANGDLLVGVVTWEVDPEVDSSHATHIHFSWRDSVEFSDGTVVSSTGRFVDSRPPGLVIRCRLVCLLGFCVLLCS